MFSFSFSWLWNDRGLKNWFYSTSESKLKWISSCRLWGDCESIVSQADTRRLDGIIAKLWALICQVTRPALIDDSRIWARMLSPSEGWWKGLENTCVSQSLTPKTSIITMFSAHSLLQSSMDCHAASCPKQVVWAMWATRGEHSCSLLDAFCWEKSMIFQYFGS